MFSSPLRLAPLLATAALACLPRATVHPRAAEEVERGYRHLAAGEPERAEVAFAHALAFDPDLAEAENGLGVVARVRGDPIEARRRFERALGLDAGFAEGHANLGELLLAEGRPDDAEAALGEALRLDPDLGDARQNLARSLLRRAEAAGSDRAALRARARREVLHLLEADPERAAAHHDLGLLEYLDGRFDRAERSYRRAVELAPASPEALHGLCNALARLGRCAEAARACERCLEAAPATEACRISLRGARACAARPGAAT
jgi:Flp pilus assembly protein TadD